MSDVYYFYDGFNKPKEIDINDLVLEHNYKGDVSDIFLEEHNEWKNESDEDYNAQMWEFRIFRNPTLEELQEANRSFGLRENDYLDDFI